MCFFFTGTLCSVILNYKLFRALETRFVRRGQQRSSRLEVFCRRRVLENFPKFTGKHLCQILFFDKVAGLRLANLLKKRLWHRCFPVNFAKFLRTLFLQNTSSGCFCRQRIQGYIFTKRFIVGFWQGPKYTFNISHKNTFSIQKHYSQPFSTIYLLLRLWNCTYFNIPMFHCLKDLIVPSIAWSMDYPNNYLYTFVVSKLS